MPLLSTFGAASARSFGGIGAAAAGAGLDIDEVFSTFLYTGTASNKTITNGIDLSGEGGLTWIKSRSHSNAHALFDTARGAGNYLNSANSNAQNQGSYTDTLTGFTSTGFTLGSDADTWWVNANNYDYASWTWRKAPKFFDIVTYTGNGTAGRTVSHNLGSVPGMIIFKKTSAADNWAVYHRGANGGTDPEDYRLELNENFAQSNRDGFLYDTAPTATHFTVGDGALSNTNGATYVAYLFAHNDGDGGFGPDGDQDIIKCGSVNANSTFTLPWQPQWILSKDYNRSGDWHIIDSMRGFTASSNYDNYLEANNSNAEQTAGWFDIDGNTLKNRSGGNIIYVAIRRGPLAEPTSATDVFAIDTQVNQDPPKFDSGFVVDFEMTRNVSSTANWAVGSRLIQSKQLNTDNENAETFNPANAFDFMDGWNGETSSTNSNVYSWMWKRAPGYFDVVCYDGSGSNRTISHNLGVAPEMIWVKCRSHGSRGWMTYHSGTGATHYLMVNSTAAAVDLDVIWNDTAPTSSVFSVGTGGSVNESGKTYIAYLFATVAGVSKVGSYTGNGGTQNIDCGFSSGARFVLIKQTSNSGNWYVWDTTRGIVAGNDPYLSLNNTTAQTTDWDYIDPYSAGFSLTYEAIVNESGRSFIFYAIA